MREIKIGDPTDRALRALFIFDPTGMRSARIFALRDDT